MIQKRWAVLKTDEATENYEAIEDLAYMIHVTRKSDTYSSRTHDICHHMMRIVSKLRSRSSPYLPEKVMVIIHKYL